MSWNRTRHWRWLALLTTTAALTATAALAATVPAGASLTATQSAGGSPPGHYAATIIRTAYGVPHITARNFGSLGYGFGYAFASDNICTMANDYVTVEAQRSRYFGPTGQSGYGPSNLHSDFFWQSQIQRHAVSRLLAVRHGPGAILPQVRQLMAGYVAGYNGYLASVGGSTGVPDPTCRGQAWVKPITTQDAYLRILQLADQLGDATNPNIVEAHPPVSARRPAPPVTAAALLSRLTPGEPAALKRAQIGSNAIAIGSAGTRGQDRPGMLLGNPHYPWTGPLRFYEAQLTIPGTVNVEGGSLFGVPLIAIGFTATMAWSHTVSTPVTNIPYQLTLVPGHPTEYVYNGKPVAMTSQTVTVQARQPGGTLAPVRDTIWYSRYGPMTDPAGWTTKTAYTVDDVNAANIRLLNHFLATDEARSAAQELSVLKKYEGLPWVNTLVADSSGHALYADIQAIPGVTNAEVRRCNTPAGRATWAEDAVPVLNGARPSCALVTGPGAAAPGLFGPGQEPSLQRQDFVESSNDSYWMSNPAHPLTGFPRVIGLNGTPQPGAAGTDLGLRTRSALNMIAARISGTDGLGSPGFTLADLKNLFYSDIQYGARLVKPQLVGMCRGFPHGMAPTGTGTIPVGDSCRVLAAWNGRENPDSHGAVLFREFWERALGGTASPWTHPFDLSHPVSTPYGLNTASPAVRKDFGDALAAMTAAHLPYDVPLSAVQYALRGSTKIPVPGGPGDPYGEFNAVYTDAGVAVDGSSYVQAVTWKPGDACPEADNILTYSESANPGSPHYADQTELFSRKGWATAYFCPAQVAAHALSMLHVAG